MKQFFLPHDSNNNEQNDLPTDVNNFENLNAEVGTTSHSSKTNCETNFHVPRRTTREINKPKYIDDYACTNQAWCNIVQNYNLTKDHQKIVSFQEKYKEPTSYKEAAQDPNWITSMNKELEALTKNET